MTLMYKISGGHNIVVKKGEKIKVVIYDHTQFDKDLKIISTYTTVKNPKDLFTFKENDIVKVLENTGNIKTLTIVKSYQIPYFNFATNKIIPSDKWKIPKSLHSMRHHSLSYIVNYKLYYKFPDETKKQYINFSVYLYNNYEHNIIYHRCMIEPEKSKTMDHYNGKCCFGSNYNIMTHETRSIIEDADIEVKTINHCYFTENFDEMDLKNNPMLRELKKICGIQKQLRMKCMNDYKILTKYINSLSDESFKRIRMY